jgi:hypothetical protein
MRIVVRKAGISELRIGEVCGKKSRQEWRANSWADENGLGPFPGLKVARNQLEGKAMNIPVKLATVKARKRG